ncbi:hypothetical protein, partial [Endozoicomonas ascidiicola]|uniref:hypothetical protein n=1 Tax=Endozoicomonas ascidiicola TaxID=1698521 RepID=UPI001C12B05A
AWLVSSFVSTVFNSRKVGQSCLFQVSLKVEHRVGMHSHAEHGNEVSGVLRRPPNLKKKSPSDF